MNYQPNATAEDLAIGILHSVDGYFVTNEGTKKSPNYHVWVPGITHSTCDSAYADITLAVARCNYLAKNKVTLPYEQPKTCGYDCGCMDNSECRFNNN